MENQSADIRKLAHAVPKHVYYAETPEHTDELDLVTGDVVITPNPEYDPEKEGEGEFIPANNLYIYADSKLQPLPEETPEEEEECIPDSQEQSKEESL